MLRAFRDLCYWGGGLTMKEASVGTVGVRRVDDIAILTLGRPDNENKITRQMAEAGAAALENARRNRDIVGCVLTGERDVFCTDGDYRGAGKAGAGQLEFARAHNNLAQAMARLGKPLVAAEGILRARLSRSATQRQRSAVAEFDQ